MRPACSGGSSGGLLVERALDECYVHPAAELVSCVLQRPIRLEAEALVQTESGPVVRRHRSYDRSASGSTRYFDEASQQFPANSLLLVQRVDVDEVLDNLVAALAPRQQ